MCRAERPRCAAPASSIRLEDVTCLSAPRCATESPWCSSLPRGSFTLLVLSREHDVVTGRSLREGMSADSMHDAPHAQPRQVILF